MRPSQAVASVLFYAPPLLFAPSPTLGSLLSLPIPFLSTPLNPHRTEAQLTY